MTIKTLTGQLAAVRSTPTADVAGNGGHTRHDPDVRISVVIPCHNSAGYITDALASVAAQAQNELEVIVVDDGSTDDSSEVIERWSRQNDLEMVIHRRPINGGLTAAVSTGLQLAGGQYYTQLDADDVLAPGILERHCEFLDRHPDCGVVYGDVRIVSHDLAEELEPFLPGIPVEGNILAHLARHGSVVPLAGTVIRTSLVQEAGGYDLNASYQDWPLWLALAKITTFRYSGAMAGFMRRHPGSESTIRGRENRATRLDVLRRLLAEDIGADVQEAARWRASRVAISMWTAGDGPASARTCWQFAREHRSPGVAVLGALLAAGVPARPIRRAVRRVRPSWWV